MNFWETVDLEREYQNMSRKELASRAGFSINSISTGIMRNSIPSADIAVKISKILNVPLEYLLSESLNNKDNLQENNSLDFEERYKKYTKYHKLIEEFDKLPHDLQLTVENLIREINVKKNSQKQ